MQIPLSTLQIVNGKVRNPVSNKMVAIGLPAYNRAVRARHIIEDIKPDNPESLGVCGGDAASMSQKIADIDRSLPADQQAVRGRGRNAGHLVTRSRGPPPIKVVCNAVESILFNHRAKLEAARDFSEELRRLVEAEISRPKNPMAPQTQPQPRQPRPQQPQPRQPQQPQPRQPQPENPYYEPDVRYSDQEADEMMLSFDSIALEY